MKKNYKFYYLFGGILTLVSLSIVVISIFLPVALKEMFNEYQFLGRICIGATVLGALVFFFGIYLLKKANFLKLNQKHDIKNNKDKNT